MKSWRSFSGVYIATFLFAIVSAYFLNDYLNSSLNEYETFIGDVLNFTSILTGFLGVILGILTSISKESYLMNLIMDKSIIKKQLFINLLVPFIFGSLNIVVAISYRLALNNTDIPLLINSMNLIFIFTVLYFCITGILMTVIVFTIFFKKEVKDKEIIEVE